MSLQLAVAKVPSRKEALANAAYINPADFDILQGTPGGEVHARLGHLVVQVIGDRRITRGEIGLGRTLRDQLGAALRDQFSLTVYTPSSASDANDRLSHIVFEADFLSRGQQPRTIEHEEIEALVRASLQGQYWTIGQEAVVQLAAARVVIKLTVVDIGCVPLSALLAGTTGDVDSDATHGQLLPQSVVRVQAPKTSTLKIKGGDATGIGATNTILSPDFDFEKMGIGGLDAEFASIFRRTFVSRLFPASEIAKYGVPHVKGILLYGPPGTGKTLIARQIGRMLNCVEPKIIGGPELFNKFVGETERAVRELFEDAEAEYAAVGDDSQLHIIIFDEIDAICKARGSRGSSSTGVGDTVVNQLLAKMDGVEELNNILIIGMTNRKELIDEALLRPGRLELHLEIGLPDLAGRRQIFSIQTKTMRESGKLGDDVDLDWLAENTKNFSGAETLGLVKAATAWALNEVVDANDLAALSTADPPAVHQRHFRMALQDIVPAFGLDDSSFDSAAPNGIIAYSESFSRMMVRAETFVHQVRDSTRTPLMSVLLEGPVGCGKTSIACTLGLQSEYPFIKLISPSYLVGYTESQKCDRITKVFEDASRSALSVIIVDDVERLLEYVPIGHRFSNSLLQTLLVLMKTPPPKGRKLLVLATTSNVRLLEQMGMSSCFNATLQVPVISTEDEMVAVLRELDVFTEKQLDHVRSAFVGSIPVKKLIMVAEMAAASSDDADTAEVFLSCMEEYGH